MSKPDEQAQRRPGPRISICIPTYNHDMFIEGAVASALAQTYDDFEVVVSNNHTTDRTGEILAGFADDPRLRIVQPPTFLEMGENFRFCISQSVGTYFAFLSDDDRYAPEFLSALVPLLDDNPAVSFAFSGSVFRDKHGQLLRVNGGVTGSWVRSGVKLLPSFIQRFRATGDALLIRRDAYDAVGGITTEIGDWEICLKLLCVGDAAYCDRPLTTLTMWDDGDRLTTNRVKRTRGFAEFYAACEPFVCERYPHLRRNFVRSRRTCAIKECLTLRFLDASLRAQTRPEILRISDHPLVRARLFMSERLGLDPLIVRCNDLAHSFRGRVKSFIAPNAGRGAHEGTRTHPETRN